MATSYTSLLGLALPVQGELSGTWGDVVNNYITSYVDAAVAGTQIISGSQTAVTLSVTNGSSLSQAAAGSTGSSQYQIIRCSGNPVSLLTITAPAASKVYLIINSTSTAQSVKIVGAGPTAGVTIATGKGALVAWNGSDFVTIASNDASVITGVLAAANGGTGQSSYTTGDILYASGTTALSKLADVATGNALISGGVGVAPAYGKIGLTTHVSGTLPVANGGTGQTTYTDGQLLIGNTVGNTLTKATLTAGSGVTITNGNGSISIAATGSGGTVTSVTGTSPVASSGGNTPAISLSSGYGDTQNPYASKTANYFLAAPNGIAGVPTFRAVVAADIPTLNQNTTGTAANVTGVVAAANGGTGQSSYAVGDLVYASGTTTISKLADVATGNALISGGVGVAPSYGKIGLTTHVSGTLPVANGGTGQTTYTDGQLLIGNTTGNTLTKATLTAGSGISVTNGAGSITIAATGGGGTVTAVSVVSANGFAGTSSGGATPALTLSTSITGVLKGNGTAISAATAGTDYVAPGGALGTPSSGTLTNATGLPISTGVSGLGTGVATFLATPSSANLAAAVTDETGSGSLVFATSPTLVTPVLGTPTSGTLSNCTVDGTNKVGYLNLPQNAQTGSYTLVLGDAGKHIYHASGAGAATYTIPANGSVAYPLGTAVTFINLSSTAISIAITTDTMYLSSAGTTGTRTLAQYGSATALKVDTTTWIISGSGLT